MIVISFLACFVCVYCSLDCRRSVLGVNSVRRSSAMGQQPTLSCHARVGATAKGSQPRHACLVPVPCTENRWRLLQRSRMLYRLPATVSAKVSRMDLWRSFIMNNYVTCWTYCGCYVNICQWSKSLLIDVQCELLMGICFRIAFNLSNSPIYSAIKTVVGTDCTICILVS